MFDDNCLGIGFGFYMLCQSKTTTVKTNYPITLRWVKFATRTKTNFTRNRIMLLHVIADIGQIIWGPATTK